LKKDVNEMKRMFVELVNNPNSAVAASGLSDMIADHNALNAEVQMQYPLPAKTQTTSAPVFIQHNAPETAQSFVHHEEVDVSLNIADMEKELIIKALKKHRSKRKDAASDLGISERTLYRKLKEYDIEDL
jgi:transcriptional regulator with PAS, ATPase and Fis domain